MFALIESVNGEDNVCCSCSKNKLEQEALSMIKEYVESFINNNSKSTPDENFSKMEEYPLLIEVLKTNDAQTAMDLFVDMTDKFSNNPIFIRIVDAELMMDA